MTASSPTDPAGYLEPGTAAFRRANAALSLAGFICFALLYGTQPVLPQLSDEFRIAPAAASLSVTAGTAVMAALLIPLSLVADRYGRERLMRFGLLGASVFAAVSAVAPEFSLLVACRAGAGACIAGVPAAAMAYLGDEIAPAARARSMGIYIAANALGGMSGRFICALATQWLGWRVGLGVLALVGVVAVIAFWRLLPSPRHFRPHSMQPSRLFADVRAIYADPALRWLFAIAFVIMGSFIGLYNFLAFRLSQSPFDLGPAAIGAIFLLYAVGSVASTWAGHHAERIGRPRLVRLMSACMALGILVTLANSIVTIIAGLAIFTFGFFAVHAVASGWVGRRATVRRGLVSANYLSSYYLGGSVLGSLAGWPWSHGGWPAVVAFLLVCVATLMAIALRLRRYTDD